MSGFDRYVAIDWTGARAPVRSGIAVAVTEPGDAAPVLVLPPGGGPWTRSDVLRWLVEAGREARLLVGFDFAFSLPFARASRYFRHEAVASDLWALIDEVCAGADDFFGGAFAEDPRYRGDFWARGPRPAGFELPHRATELACREDGHGHPESPYKLLGPKQVGKGSLAGMRLLHRLAREHGDRFAIWPFEAHEDSRSVVAEIYPRLFLREAGWTTAKVREAPDLVSALAALGSKAPRASGRLDDHATDAAVAAAGLRHLARDAERLAACLSGPRADAEASLREGWILGVRRLGPRRVA